MSIPLAAVTPAGWDIVSRGSTTASVADAALHVLVEDVEHADGGALAAGAGRGRHREQRGERLLRRAALAHRGVHVVEDVAGVGAEQVDGLGGVDRGAAADRDERVPRTALARELHGLHQAGVGRLHVRPVEQHRVDPRGPDLLGDPLRVAGRRDPRVGDHEHPTDVVRREVVADLVRRAGAELQQRGTVGEHGLGRGLDHALQSRRAVVGCRAPSRPR
jgi:hypothetical protein